MREPSSDPGKTTLMTRRIALALTLTLTACGGSSSDDDITDPMVDAGTGSIDGAAGGPDAATCPPPPASLCSAIARQDDITATVDEAKAQAWADTYLAGQCMHAACGMADGSFWSKTLCGPMPAPAGAACASLCTAILGPDGAVDNTRVIAWVHDHLTGQHLDASCVLPDGSTWTKTLDGPAGW